MTTQAPTSIKATVSFPVTKKPPFSRDYTPDTTEGAILADAKDYYAVQDDAQFTYVFTHHGARVENPNETLGDIAEHAHAVEFRLVKVITQG